MLQCYEELTITLNNKTKTNGLMEASLQMYT